MVSVQRDWRKCQAYRSFESIGSLTIMRFFVVFLFSLISVFPFTSASAQAVTRPNVIFIAIDDLNHWVGYTGRNPQTKTPNIDRLSKLGMSFTKADCAAPLCNPSRAAFMSGLRPSTSGCYQNNDNWKRDFRSITESDIYSDVSGLANDILLDFLFQNAYPGLPLEMPFTFNRHKILHGEITKYGRFDNTLRAFLILDFLNSVSIEKYKR